MKDMFAPLRLLWELNPKRTAEKIGHFMEGQKVKRRYQREVAALEKEKPIYTPPLNLK